MGVGALGTGRAVFLDRDGVINRHVYYSRTGEWEAPLRPEDFELYPWTLEALRRLQAAGLPLFLVTNQPAHAKDKTTLEDLRGVHAVLEGQLNGAGITFREFYYCFHHPQGVITEYSGPCECRKPSPHFLNQAHDAHGIVLEDSWMVGDRDTDVFCGQAVGVRTIQVWPDHPDAKAGKAHPDFSAG